MLLDMNDVQGLICREYAYSRVRHLFFEVTSSAAGQALLKFLAPRTTHAATTLDPKPAYLLNVGVSYWGMQALGVNQDLLNRFPAEFKEEPDAGTMGDVGPSAPKRWWNERFTTTQVHVVVHLYGLTAEALDAITAEVRAAAAKNQELWPTLKGGAIEGGAIGSMPGETHFGYRDGISQPDVRWGEDPAPPGSVDFRNFVLGYPTDAVPSQPKYYPSTPISGKAADFVRNGCYAAFRWLYQDVARFNQFLVTVGPATFPDLTPTDAQELLAAKLMGRWRDGTPLVLSPTTPDAALSSSNAFGYAADPDGQRCPISAHIRVNNPRDQALDEASKLMGGVPRVIRRGASCGPKLEGIVDDHEERGLAGMFLCTSIQRQFYKLIVWMKENNFSPSFKDLRAQDPLANRHVVGASAQFSIPTPQGVRNVTLRDFVTTKGTAFFLLPSISSLQKLGNGELE